MLQVPEKRKEIVMIKIITGKAREKSLGAQRNTLQGSLQSPSHLPPEKQVRKGSINHV
jgi:hypothetical protein